MLNKLFSTKIAKTFAIAAFAGYLTGTFVFFGPLLVSADSSGFLSASAASANPSFASWQTASNAFASDDVYATSSVEAVEQGYQFSFTTIPAGSTIEGIEVRAEASATDTNGCRLQTRLSWNGGANNTSPLRVATLTGSDSVLTFGSPTDTWGRTWSAAEFTSSNFILKVSYEDVTGNTCAAGTVASLDHVSVNVTYTPPATPAVNPTLANSCGIDVALVLDSSGSMDATELSQLKSAFQTFVDEFIPATPTLISVTDFDATATVLQGFTGDRDLITTAINAPTSGGFTNWQDALIKAASTFDPRPDHPNLVVFASDGNPTMRNGNSTAGFQPADLNAAIAVANELKNSGTRIITLGIGNTTGADALNPDNLKALSSEDAYFSADNFGQLPAALESISTALCGGTITVKKLIDADGSLSTADDRTPAEGWTFDIAGGSTSIPPVVTGNDGFTSSTQLNAGTYAVVETVQEDFEVLSAICTGGTNNGTQSQNSIIGIEVGNSDIVSCTFINHLKQNPTITLTPPNPHNIVVNSGPYADPGYSATDVEDGDLTASVVVTGSVDTTTPGTYTLFYNVTDSDGLHATQVSRTVNVSDVPAECEDGSDNDGDGQTDLSDSGCTNADDNSENQPPEITVDPETVVITLGASFNALGGVTVTDDEDDPDPSAIVGGDSVDVNTIGDYTVTYNAVDSDGFVGTTRLRLVKVRAACADGVDNDGDGQTDLSDSGCGSEDPTDNDENSAPVITLNGSNPINLIVGAAYAEPGATADDAEDGQDIPVTQISGAVNTAAAGTYTVTYNFTDSDGAAAPAVTRTVNVAAAPACSDGIDNDEDTKIDSADPGCSGPEDTDETDPPVTTQCNDTIDNDNDGKIDSADPGCQNSSDNDETDPVIPPGSNTPPTITLIGDATLPLTLGTPYAEPGATAHDAEDGNLTANITISGSVNSNVVGTYAISYSVQDSKGASASATRTVIVGGGGGGGGGGGPIPGTIVVSGGGGGGGGLVLGAATTAGEVLGASVAMCQPYLTSYIKFGAANDPDQVMLLQRFLKNVAGFLTVSETGIYDDTTHAAVHAYQKQYQSEILDPWGITESTGYVYYTTQKKINEAHCNYTAAFPLTASQMSEIARVREFGLAALVEALPQRPQSQGASGTSTLEEDDTDTDEAEDEDSEDDGEGFWSKVKKFFRNLFN